MVDPQDASRGVREGGSDIVNLLVEEVGEIIRGEGGGGRRGRGVEKR